MSFNLDLLVPATVNGVVLGVLYGLLALSIVVLFRTTGVANFAAGSLSMFGTFIVFLVINGNLGLGLWPSFFVGLPVAGVIGMVLYFLVFAPRSGLGALNLTVRTLGTYLLLFAIATRVWSSGQPYTVPGLFSRDTVKILGFFVSYDQIGAIAVAIAVAAGFFLFFGRTGLGLKMRAVASDWDTACLVGVNVRSVEIAAWMIATVLALVVGVLFAPITLVSSDMMEPFLIGSFAAAMLGGIYSFPGAIIGGLLLGIVQSVAATYLTLELQYVLTLAIMATVLIVRPSGIFGTSGSVRL